jgi:hypothetical protein
VWRNSRHFISSKGLIEFPSYSVNPRVWSRLIQSGIISHRSGPRTQRGHSREKDVLEGRMQDWISEDCSLHGEGTITGKASQAAGGDLPWTMLVQACTR